MKKITGLVLGALFIGRVAVAQECTADWDAYLDTDPSNKQVISGDSHAGYAIYPFISKKNLRFELKGNFPHVRFMSLETYKTRYQLKSGLIIDSQIDADAGSENPFRNGGDLNAVQRAYTISVVPTGMASKYPNSVELPDFNGTQVLMLRLYSPEDGYELTRKDLPKIFAYDAVTNEPVQCPKLSSIPIRFHFPQVMIDVVSQFTPFEFKTANVAVGQNNAIPKYLYAYTEMKRSEVAVMKFKVPRSVRTDYAQGKFDDTQSDVRYWSFCTQNFLNNETLNCMPDSYAKPDANGFVKVVVGTGEALRKEAEANGFYFLSDDRGPRQKVMGFALRNILPNATFRDTEMYLGDYHPSALKCSLSEFMKTHCGY